MSAANALKRLLPRTLLARSLLIIVTPLVLLQVVSAYIFYGNHWDTVARRLASGVAGDVAAIIELLRTNPGAEGRRWVEHLALTTMTLEVSVEDGAILPNTQPERATWTEDILAQALAERLQRPFLIDDAPEREVVMRIQLTEGVLRVAAPRKRLYSSTTYIFVLWMVGTSLLLFGVATIFMRNQVRSVRRLAAAADEFGKGRDVPNFKPEGAAEVRQAAIAFNRMRERLRRQIAQRTEMLAGVSHDLRTPLTRMKLQLAMMGEDDAVADLAEDVGEMQRMVEGYLAFARGEGSEPMRPASFVALAEEVVTRIRRDGTSIDFVAEEDAELPMRADAMARCLGNLIGNAVRYARTVVVRAGRKGETVEAVIDDDGPGIPFDKREEVFKAFARLETSRNPRTGGVGLGLTIARDIARGHGGDIRLEDSPLGGLRVRLRLPL